MAPPGHLLRVVEDEPYIYAAGDSSRRSSRVDRAVSSLRLIGVLDDGGRYEARILLRQAGPSTSDQLLESFDQAAHSAYKHAAIQVETREHGLYRLSEVRSPLGLLGAERGRQAVQREFLAYDAEVVNPLAAEDFANLSTPYRTLNGQLQVAWQSSAARQPTFLLSIGFAAQNYPHSLTLSENIARCVLNRCHESLSQERRLNYLAYHPEFELPGLNLLWAGKNIDVQTADLAEQPGEGAGIDPLAIQGDLCPEGLGGGPFWPAQPYQDAAHITKLQTADGSLPLCSHCLLSGTLTEQQHRELEQRQRNQSTPAHARRQIEAETAVGPEPAAEPEDSVQHEMPEPDQAPDSGILRTQTPQAFHKRCALCGADCGHRVRDPRRRQAADCSSCAKLACKCRK